MTMNNIFKQFFFIATFAISVLFISCDSMKESKGQKASKEACECIKKKTLKECEDEMNSKYVITSKFIDDFNKENSCGIKLEKKK